uniref:Uncharacterized protein n=1 Tax=Arundo donax TaxID=35708 RepID=A0A0A9HKH4_ARUDO
MIFSYYSMRYQKIINLSKHCWDRITQSLTLLEPNHSILLCSLFILNHTSI